jgi:hypothetical protein
MQTLDLEKLPPRARLELMDFYEFLMDKYASTEKPKVDVEKPSRWRKIAQRVHEDNRYPGGWSDQLKQDMREFRENSNFKHDET